MSRRKKKHEEHIDETWLIPYSDLLTLLLALFIVMFAMSKVDEGKFEQFGYAWREMVESGYIGVASDGDKGGIEAMVPENEARGPESNDVLSEEEIRVVELQAKIEEYIKKNHLENEMSTKYYDDGLFIVINDSILFESGQADVVIQEHEDIIHDLATLFKELGSNIEIVVSGHTDDVPIYNSKFDSNWRLSTERAINFMQAILEDGHLDQGMFSARGYGEQKPLVPNDLEENRAKNRRVEVLVRPIHHMTNIEKNIKEMNYIIVPAIFIVSSIISKRKKEMNRSNE